MREAVALLRALREINKGTERLAKLLSEALSREATSSHEPLKRSSRITLVRKGKTKNLG
jgi:hypothetical protein